MNDKKVYYTISWKQPYTEYQILQEAILELSSVYMNKLIEFDSSKVKLSDDARKIREIMQDWTVRNPDA